MIKTCRNFIVNSNWPLVNKLEEKTFLLPNAWAGKPAAQAGSQLEPVPWAAFLGSQPQWLEEKFLSTLGSWDQQHLQI